jgi:predicted dehydrogenase
MADPTWREAHKYITEGNLGKVLQGQTSYYRNYIGGQWRYYPLNRLGHVAGPQVRAARREARPGTQ